MLMLMEWTLDVLDRWRMMRRNGGLVRCMQDTRGGIIKVLVS
jgi:hypothetical protein